MNKNIQYNLNEDNLRSLFEQYSVNYDENHWAETERNLDALGLQRKNSLTMRAKKMVLLCCLVVIGGGLAAFININKTARSTASNSAAVNSAAVSAEAEYTALKFNTEISILEMARKTVAAPTIIAAVAEPEKKEEIAAAENTVRPNEETVKSGKKTEEKTAQVSDSSSNNTNEERHEPKKKKKRKKRRSHGDGNAPAVRSASEDDVIISE